MTQRRRIPENELERIKREMPITVLCRHYGIELKQEGKDFVGLCPFHEEKTGSFRISVGPQGYEIWNCLGRADCGGGDNIRFVMAYEKVSFLKAVDILRRMLGEVPETEAVTTKMGTTHEILAKPDDAMPDHVLRGHVVNFYHETFCNEAKAMRYLQDRKCFHPEAVKLFKIGFANRTLGYRVPMTTAEGRKLKEQLQRIGVFRTPKPKEGQEVPKTGGSHEHMNGRIVIPLFDRNGNPAQMYGRAITPNLPKETPKHMYLTGSLQATVFNWQGVLGQKEVILSEAPLDALTFWCAGFRNVTSLLGVKNFTAALWSALEESQPERLILCMDADPAGESALAKYVPELMARLPKTTLLCVRIPHGKDVNAYACASTNATAALAALLESAEVIYRSVKVVSEPSREEPFSLAADAVLVAEVSEAEASIETACEPVDVTDQEKTTKIKEPSAEPELTTEPPPALQPEREPSPPPKSEPPPALQPEPSSPAPKAEPPPDINTGPDEQTYLFGERAWRVRGMATNSSYGTLKIQLRVLIGPKNGERYHADTLDMCNAKHRDGFVDRAHRETGISTEILKRDMSQLYLKLEDLQAENIRKATEPKKPEVVEISDEARKEAVAYLSAPNLRQRLLADYKACGVVGEETPLEVCHYAALTRVFEKPLSVIIQSSTAAGKSTLMDANLAFIPDEAKIKYSAMTGQALFYLGETNIQNKVLAIAEEEGAERATYALKLLLSDGEVSIASAGKDPATGRMTTEVYCSKGPTQVIFATTALEIEEELANRCMIVAVDESREQTRRIHAQQAFEETAEGYLAAKKRKKICELHQNIQRVLKNLPVYNPYARLLTFPAENTRLRRDKKKYLTLIRAIAYFHQYQRQRVVIDGEEYILVDVEDIAIANELCGKVFGQSLDEMAPQTRRFLNQVLEMVKLECARQSIEQKDFRFGQKEIRDFTGLTYQQVKRHMAKLSELEYVIQHRAKRGQSFVYELVYNGEGQDGSKFVLGLLDVDQLRQMQLNLDYDGKRDTKNGQWDISGSPQGHAKDTPGLEPKIDCKPSNGEGLQPKDSERSQKTHIWKEKEEANRSAESNDTSSLAANSSCSEEAPPPEKLSPPNEPSIEENRDAA